jgi:hypothetical protein
MGRRGKKDEKRLKRAVTDRGTEALRAKQKRAENTTERRGGGIEGIRGVNRCSLKGGGGRLSQRGKQRHDA